MIMLHRIALFPLRIAALLQFFNLLAVVVQGLSGVGRILLLNLGILGLVHSSGSCRITVEFSRCNLCVQLLDGFIQRIHHG